MIVDTLDEDCAWGWQGTASGLRIILHDQQAMVFPDEEGLSAGWGEATLLGAHQLTVEKINNANEECIIEMLQASWKDNVFADRYPVLYSTRVRKYYWN